MLPIGTIYNYAKSLQLQQKWALKQKGIATEQADFSPRTASTENADRQKAFVLSGITSKLKSGQRLSTQEMEYLRINAPELHKKAAKILEERDEYRRTLHKCRNKNEVAKANNKKIHELAAAAATAAASQSTSVEDMEFVEMRINAIQSEHRSFLETQKYQKLPEKQNKERKKSLDSKA